MSGLSEVVVTFSEPVTGAQAADLQINGEPATSVSVSNAIARFRFSQPAPGQVSVAFDADAVITDLGGLLFDTLAPGAAWTYTLSDNVAPTVVSAEPAFGAVVGALTQLEVIFQEPVSGVDAADLLVNGVPATSVTGVAPERYRFGFAPAAAGSVTIRFVAGHGIQDLAPVPNPFPGAQWTCTVNPVAANGDVVINEFLVENRSSIKDEDGQQEDWIEVRNRGAVVVNLTGWSLTDDPAEPGKWVFPNLTLNPGQHLIVFASGKDRRTSAAGRTNHTNFRLSLEGGYLGLFNAGLPRQAVSVQAAYPEQRADVAYGLTAGGVATYFSTPTPGAANNEGSAASGIVAPPHLSVRSGFFNAPFNLVLSTETPGAEIRYTLDGSVPTAASELYTGPLTVSGTASRAVATVRVAAFKAGQVPSSVVTRTYIFPDQVLNQPANPSGFPTIWDSPCTGFNNCNDINPADYEMDTQVLTNTTYNYRAVAREGLVAIPTVSIVTDVNLLFGAAQGVYVRREPFLRKPVNAEFIPGDGSEGWQIDCGLEMQGQTSPDDSSTGGSKWKSLKLGLRLFFQGEFGPTKLRHKVFEDSPVEEFDTLLLGGGHNNYWNYNNNDTQRTRSLYVRDQFAANLQNLLGGRSHHGRFVHLYLNGLYWGLYQLHERPDESFQSAYYGGEKAEYDVFKHDKTQLVAGSAASYDAMWAILNQGMTNNTRYEQVQQYLDLEDLIHYLLVNYWLDNTDWAHKNLYASHRRNGKWRFHAWDSEHVIATGATSQDALNDNEGTNPTAIFNRLLANPEFRVLVADTIHRHFFNGGIFYVDPANPIYNPAFPERNPAAHMFMQMLKGIDTAIVCESARWGDVGPGRETNPHLRDTSFYEERDIVMGYRATFGSHSPGPAFFPNRSTNVLGVFRTRGWYPSVVAPSFSQHGGQVAAGFGLVMTAPAGTIYYTTNGADPRVYGSGAVSPQARAYAGSPLGIAMSMVVKARVLSGTNWSALNEAAFTVAQLASPLRLTEIMYNPVGGDAYEYIELRNTGPVPVSLTGHSFQGITYAFPPGAELAAGAALVLANNANPTAFAARYPGVVAAGYFGGNLANGGERIALLNGAGQTVLSVTYSDGGGWPAAADGAGASLELVDFGGPSSEPGNWQASAAAGGTPGQPNSAPAPSSVLLNEVAAENVASVGNAGTFGDWLELANAGGSPVSLAGWSLTDDSNARKYVFPAGTTVPAGGYLVVWCDPGTNGAPGLHTGFALDRDGDSLFLFNAQTQRVDSISFGTQLADRTVARVGGAWVLATPTPGAPNVATAVAGQSVLTINEWMANAAPGTDDWVELHNRSASLPVGLGGLHVAVGPVVSQIRSLSFVAPGGFIQMLADEGSGANHLDFKLPAAGGELSLYDAAAVLLEKVTFGAQQEAISQGRLPDGGATVVLFPGSASPAAPNYQVTYTGPVLNEVLARNDSSLAPWGTAADWVEIANAGATPVDLGGMGLTDEASGAGRWLFPAGTTLPGNGFIRVWCDGGRAPSVAAGNDLNTGFGLSGESGGVYLYNAGGQRVDAVDYGFQVPDLSIGRSGGAWRLLAAPTPGAANSAAAALGPVAGVKLNEWMSEPLSGPDWFELFNAGTAPVDLAGLHLTDDPTIAGRSQHRVAALSFIGARGFVRFVADGDAAQGRDHVGFNLDRLGEVLRVYAADLALLDSVELLPHPAGVSAGRLPDGGAAVVAFPTSSSPGESNYLPLTGAVIHEVLTHTDAPLEDSIEIHNPTGEALNIGGYYLSDSGRDLRKYRIPDGTVLPAGGYLVVGASQFNAGGAGSFALSSSRGGVAWLSAVDGGGNLTGFRSIFPFGPQRNGVSFGRVATSVGDDFAALTARTLGSANALMAIGPVVLHEVHYHPVSGPLGAELGEQEFIELHNVTGSPVACFDPANPGNTWRVTGAVTYQFPAGFTLGARAYALLVGFDPVAAPAMASSFRSVYGVDPSVPLLGPWAGRLANEGETIVLEQPDTPQGPGPDAGLVPYVVVDRLAYGGRWPWPATAEGGGDSLQRRRTGAHGNDPVNWKGTAPTPGRANVVGSTFADVDADGLPDAWEQANGLNPADAADAGLDPDGDGRTTLVEYQDGTDPASGASGLQAPVITTQPADLNATPGQGGVLSVVATGSPVLQYQWRKDGYPIAGATGASLALGGLIPFNAGRYSVMVWNGAGFAVSREARVLVNIPPRITLQPVGLSVLPGTNVNFTVAATGTGLVRYQWQKDGQDIPGATSATLSLSSVQLADEAEYAAVVTDDLASVRSTGVRLIVRVAPTFLVQLRGSTNLVGSSVTFTVVMNGSVPMGFQWRKGSLPLTNIVSLVRTSTFTLNNLTLADAATYRVIVTNAANPSPGVASAQVTLAVVEPPVITAQPQSLVVDAGAPAAFAVTATGSAPLRYQWFFEGAPIAGATNANHAIAAVQASDQGGYRVDVSNIGATVSSAVATLTVNSSQPPRLSDLERLANGHIRLNLSGSPNRTYSIEGSSNLVFWTNLGSLFYTNGLVPFVDTNAPGAPSRFYRAREGQ